MSKQKQIKLWKRAEPILSAVRGGKRLCKLHRQMDTGETDVVFFLEPGGCRVGTASALNAIAAGGLVPANDGLFGPETSQSWGLS